MILNEINSLIGQFEIPFHFSKPENEDYYISPVIVLKYCMNQIHPNKPGKLPDAMWSEYFAVLALALIAQDSESGDDELPQLGLTKEAIREYNQNLTLSLTSDSLDAVGFAETLAQHEESTQKASRRGKPGAQAKNAPANYLKRMVLDIYKRDYAEKDVSNARAASCIWAKVERFNQTPTGDDILKPEGAVDRIAVWIGDYKRGK